jgi:putative salt-induced outer membrane protein
MNKRFLTLVVLSFLAPVAGASEWKGTGEFGLVISSGNADTETLNAKLGITREMEKWLHEAHILALRAKGDDVTTADRWEVGAKTGYKFDDRRYVFGAVRHEDDDFAPFERQTAVTAGYGHIVIKEEATHLSFEVGPGYRWADPQTWELDSDGDFILRGAMDFKHNINASTSIYDALLIEAGSDNTFAQNDFGVMVKMSESFALKAGLLMRHNTDVGPGIKKTDTLTTVNLVYGF